MSLSDHAMTSENIGFSTRTPQEYYNYTFDGEDLPDNQKIGTHEWRSTSEIQKYTGLFLNNNLHGKGIYTGIKTPNSYMYEGFFYANNLEGYATVTYNNCTCFEGLFKNNARFGPGVLTHVEGQQDVGIWEGDCLIRLSRVVLENWVPKLGKTAAGQANLLKYRKVVPLMPVIHQPKFSSIVKGFSEGFDQHKLYNVHIRNPNSTFFNREEYDELYFHQDEQFIEVLESEELPKSEVFNVEDEIQADLIPTSEIFGDSEVGEEEEKTSAEDNFSPEEMELLKIKFNVLDTLGRITKFPTKKVEVTDLLAWNNEEIFIDVLKHTFLHRNHENVVGFDVSKLIAGVREEFGVPGEMECACIAFLTACSEGTQEKVCALYEDFKLNPDLCDVRGNTGIMYAACRDRVAIIRVLVELGGNLDASNDECMTPLGICFLRYLAVLYNIENWEQGFVDYGEENAVHDFHTWYSPPSFTNLIMHSALNYVAHCNSSYFEDGSVLELFRIASILYSTSDLDRLFQVLNLKKPCPETQNFQKVYECSEENTTPYLFANNFDFTKVQQHEDKEEQLEVIFNTIMLLLHYNADLLKCIQPRSALILALYTKNEEILAKVLEAGADPNEQTHFLSPIHLLCTLQPDETWIKFLKILLEKGADPNARTLFEVYPEQTKLIGEADSDEDVGKTSLHILAVRPDYSGHIGTLAKLLIDYGGALSAKFLGHTPLSLAVLKGNIDLVKVLLESAADPNEKLNCKLGSPLTIYTLLRYANALPPIKTCMLIIDKLVDHFGNLLIPISNFGNAIEFVKNQGVSLKPQKEIIEYLTIIARRTAYIHYQGKALLKLFLMIVRREPQTAYFSNIAKLLTIDDALRIIQLLINKKIVKLENDMHYIGLHFLLEYLSKNVSAGPNKSKPSPDIANMLNGLKTSVDTTTYKFNSFNEFELHNWEQIYIICYQCCFRTNKLLLPCPKCGEVYFCSQECNKLARTNKLKHPCDSLFYDNKRRSSDSCPADIKKNIHYYLSELAKALYKFEHNPNIYEDLLMEFIVTQGQIINPFKIEKDSETDDRRIDRNISKQPDKTGKTLRILETAERVVVGRDRRKLSDRNKAVAAERDIGVHKKGKEGEDIVRSKDRKMKESRDYGERKETKEGGLKGKDKKKKESGDESGLNKKRKKSEDTGLKGEDTGHKGKTKKRKESGDNDETGHKGKDKKKKESGDNVETGHKGKDKKKKESGDNDDTGRKGKDKKKKGSGDNDDTGHKGKAKKKKEGDDNDPQEKKKRGEDTGQKRKDKKGKESGDNDEFGLHKKTKKEKDTGPKGKDKKTKERGGDTGLKGKGKKTKESSDNDDFGQRPKTKKGGDIDHKGKGKKMKESQDNDEFGRDKKTKKGRDTERKSRDKKTKEDKKTKDTDHRSKSTKSREGGDMDIGKHKKIKKDADTSQKSSDKKKEESSFKNRKAESKVTKQLQTDYSTTKRILKKPILEITTGFKEKDMAAGSRKIAASYSDEKMGPSYQFKTQSFMRFHIFATKMVDLFPDMDILALMLPFVCFREGQLYYKFIDKELYHTCMTYSSV